MGSSPATPRPCLAFPGLQRECVHLTPLSLSAGTPPGTTGAGGRSAAGSQPPALPSRLPSVLLPRPSLAPSLLPLSHPSCGQCPRPRHPQPLPAASCTGHVPGPGPQTEPSKRAFSEPAPPGPQRRLNEHVTKSRGLQTSALYRRGTALLLPPVLHDVVVVLWASLCHHPLGEPHPARPLLSGPRARLRALGPRRATSCPSSCSHLTASSTLSRPRGHRAPFPICTPQPSQDSVLSTLSRGSRAQHPARRTGSPPPSPARDTAGS